MTAFAFVVQSIGWAAVGFVIGFLTGRTARDVHRIADAVTTTETTGDHAVPTSSRRRWHSLNGQAVVAIVVVLLGVLTVVQGFVQSAATERLTQCQLDYSNQFADALDARSESTAKAQAALDELITGIGELLRTGPTDGAVVQAAIADYIAKRSAVKAQQQANPYPQPPRTACP